MTHVPQTLSIKHEVPVRIISTVVPTHPRSGKNLPYTALQTHPSFGKNIITNVLKMQPTA